MLYSNVAFLSILVVCFLSVFINYVYLKRKTLRVFDSRASIDLEAVWLEYYDAFDYELFESVWIELASIMEVPYLKVVQNDTISRLSDFSSIKELCRDEVERYLGSGLIETHNITVNHTFGSVLRLKLEKMSV